MDNNYQHYRPVREADIDREVRLKNALRAWKNNEEKLEKLVPYAKQLEEENSALKRQLAETNSETNRELSKQVDTLNKRVIRYEKFIEETFPMRVARRKNFRCAIKEHQKYIAYLEELLSDSGVHFEKYEMKSFKTIESELPNDFAVREKADIINKLENF